MLYNDIPIKYNLWYQNSSNSMILDRIVMTDILSYWSIIVLIIIILLIIDISITDKYNIYNNKLYESKYIELIYSILPSILLIILVQPWLHAMLLYTNMTSISGITLQIIGYQWYWYNNIIIIYISNNEYILNNIYIICYTKSYDIVLYRLLESDNIILLPILTNIKLLVCSSDIIHSYSIPSLGIKIDCIPSKINNNIITIYRESIYNGSCLEGRGIYHYNMNFMILATNYYSFIWWFNYILNNL